MTDCCSAKGCEIEEMARQAGQRRVLIVVLLLNSAMFFVEFTAGLIAGSTALMADSVDMLGDAFVYVLSLYALTRSSRWKAGAAMAKGVFILVFGAVIVVEAISKAMVGVPPSSTLMFIFGSLALAVNLGCFALLWRYRTQDVNMSSSFECSRNDLIANTGVLIAAAAVLATASPWPDIVIGLLIAAVFLRSAVRVLAEAWPMWRAGTV
ncbi:cation diffusion facilitator family transporter [Parasphingopyxis marina]|uniref:Cation transporter n=1 Tax=Parasphingopyxis marina TaxID=2761622 RepID=A0A842HZ57_9SPHN|nr:cation diffusion facilitator family transporter [Parasphingopyxis marina]MBC2778135.1 cation transporter [Parasphingopyxis marina]